MVHQKIFLSRVDKDIIFFKHSEIDAAKKELERPLTEQLNDSKDLLFNLVKVLEPRRLNSLDIIQRSDDNVQEIIFMMVGTLDVGYNHQQLLHQNKMSMEKDVRPFPDTGKKF